MLINSFSNSRRKKTTRQMPKNSHLINNNTREHFISLAYKKGTENQKNAGIKLEQKKQEKKIHNTNTTRQIKQKSKLEAQHFQSNHI